MRWQSEPQKKEDRKSKENETKRDTSMSNSGIAVQKPIACHRCTPSFRMQCAFHLPSTCRSTFNLPIFCFTHFTLHEFLRFESACFVFSFLFPFCLFCFCFCLHPFCQSFRNAQPYHVGVNTTSVCFVNETPHNVFIVSPEWYAPYS